MQSNFNFLNKDFPVLAHIGSIAESYLYSDTNSCLIKLGMFGETTVNLMLQLDNIEPPTTDNTHANRIRLLKQNGLIPRYINDILYALRTNRNNAIHENFESEERCKTLLQMAHTLSVWFMQTYHNQGFIAKPFILPENNQENYQEIILKQESQIKDLANKLNEIKSSPLITSKRIERGEIAASLINLTEKETRYIIDEQLRRVGWEADTENIRYSKGTRPQKSRNLAIAEWQTNSSVNTCGYADYALFVGLQMVGIIEVKKTSIDIPSAIDVQCKDYAKNIKPEDDQYIIQSWYDYKVPFVFATNGKKYLKQLETKSGIWFLDLRQDTNIPKAFQGWVSPQGILELLEKDIKTATTALNKTPFDLLTDKDGLNLREYQIEAITVAEKAIVDGKNTVLLSMATGTGKTRTILGMIYRFLKSKRFKRILFLVDRTALGEQAEGVFKDVKIEDLMTLNEIYNIKNLEDKAIEIETKVQIATIQGLVKRVLYNESDSIPAVSDYDLIIIDEAHRGYILDKELSDDEIIYRNQDDFISKYRTVIEYFNAVKVAITATPALHTTEIFGKPVFTYSYRKAVVENYLVDHNAPHHIETELSKDGINYKKGDIVTIYDPITNELINGAELPDELNFSLENFNRRVISESFNRTVLKTIAKNLDPDGEGKTLIYAVDDQHADSIVKILQEIYETIGVHQDAIMKITSKTGDKKHVRRAIKHFKNERYPNIAVTVDLLTTGIDIPEITTLVFMRRVKSRILFEQMLGRATRLCPHIDKPYFTIYDPVGVYESLQDVNTMKPVVANASATFIDLLNGLEILPSEEQIQNQIDLILAKLHRNQRYMTPQQKDYFTSTTDCENSGELMKKLKSLPVQEKKKFLLDKKELFMMLNEGGLDTRRATVISDKEDTLIGITRGFGKGKKPQDYLEEFKAYILENVEKIEAMKLICTSPSDLTRQALKSLKFELDRNGFTEIQLNTAWNETKSVDIGADIISFIRAEAIGCELLGHEDRIKKAISKLKQAHNFSVIEKKWIERIEKHLLTEIILDEESFNEGAFKTEGGFAVINKKFSNKLKEYIIELNQYLYDDKGTVA